MIHNMVPGISTVITGAMLRFIRSTISRKNSGVKLFIDRLKAIHGPWNIPTVRAESTMLISCHVFIVGSRFSSRRLAAPILAEGHDTGPGVRVLKRGVKPPQHPAGHVTRFDKCRSQLRHGRGPVGRPACPAV